MAQFVIENFSNGLDLRRSHDTAPSGSLRVLRNAFINEGGEIEKRKAFYREPALSAYARSASYTGRITGPHASPYQDREVFFRHRHNSLPTGGGWVVGSGGVANSLLVNDEPTIKVWAMKSTLPLTDFGAMFRASTTAQFGAQSHVVESFRASVFTVFDNQHIEVVFDNAGQPTAESVVTDNNNFTGVTILKSKGYVSGGNTLKASAINDPGDMAGTGSGAVDTRTQSAPIGGVQALGDYYGQLVVMGSRGAQFWDVDADFDQNQYLRTVPLSLFARGTVIGYGDGDVLYLDRTGIRSLQARDSSNLAKISDVGSPIDALIQAAIRPDGTSETTDGNLAKLSSFFPLAKAAVHPASGQFWLLLKEKVYVLSNQPSAGVKAWSVFDLPTPATTSARNGPVKSRWAADIAPVNDHLMLRNYADDVYIYGGLDGLTYDASEVEIVTPHMDMGSPSTAKDFTGIDIACTGTWKVEVSVDPQNIFWEHIADITNSTHRINGRIPIDFSASHIAVRLTSVTAAAAKVGQITLLYNGGTEK